jgi:hypothetical protein
VARACILIGTLLVAAGMTFGVWPQNVDIDGVSHACPFAAVIPMGDPWPVGSPKRLVNDRCQAHNLTYTRVAFGLGVVGVGLVAIGATSLRRRRSFST